MNSSKYILAIDQGTTSTRAILVDEKTRVCAMAQKECQVFYPQPGWVEQDALEIWLDCLAVCADVLSQGGISIDQLAAIGISNQRETTVLWDRRTGMPVRRSIVWQSRQTAGICERWKQEGLEEMVREKTGLRIDPYFSASKIAWMFEHVPGLKEKAQRGEVLAGTMDSWLVWKLTYGALHITDVANASRTMLCNIETGQWDNQLLQAFGIPRCILPEIVASSDCYGTTSPLIFFGSEVPICSMIGDQQAALFGQLCLQEGMAKNTYGTGGFLLMNTGSRVVRSSHGLLSTIAWKLDGKMTYALEGSIFASGSILKWMRDQLHLFDDVAATERIAIEAGSCGGVMLVPAFTGLGAPYWDDQARAALLGMTFSTQRGQIVRAGLESMAFQSRDLIEAMEQDARTAITCLKVDGGAAANNFLLQFQSDLCQIPVERYKVRELTALGASFLAGLAIGLWSLDDLSLQEDRIFTPEKTREQMKPDYENWQAALQAARLYKPQLS